MVELEYTISKLGRIKAYIHSPYASNCYEFLKKKNYIKKLSEMNQLGVIDTTSLRTAHTREEYVILQLYILNLLQGRTSELNNSQNHKKTYNLGLSNNIDVKIKNKHETPTGAEIIQIWILLFNSGHMIETFASERGFLKALQNNKNLYKLIRDNIPENFKSHFVKSVKHNDLYNIHKYIMIFLLERNKRSSKILPNGSNSIEFMEKVIELYFLSEDEKILKLKNFYDKIRKISYLFLDSQYSSFPISFSITALLINIEYYLDDLFDENSTFNRTLTSLDKLLTHNLYYSKESMESFSLHSDEIYKKFNKRIWKLTTLKDELEKNYKNCKTSKEKLTKKDSLNLLLEYDSILSRLFYKNLNNEIEKKWNAYLGENSLLTIETNKRFEFTIINLVFTSGKSYNHILSVSKLFNKLIGFRNSFYSDVKNLIENNPNNLINNNSINELIEIFDTRIDTIFDNAFKEILLYILNNTTKNHYFSFNENQTINVISVHGFNTVENIFNKIDDKSLSKSKIYEKEVNKHFTNSIISNKTSKALIALSSIQGYYNNEKNQESVEIDGLILRYKDKKLHLYLIEAKKQKHNSISDAKKDLEKKLVKLNFNSKKPIFTISNSPKGVMCHLIITED